MVSRFVLVLAVSTKLLGGLGPSNPVGDRVQLSCHPCLTVSRQDDRFGSPRDSPLVSLLGIPALVPAVLAAYSVVRERQQATLEPVLTTPIPREEFLLGKALAALLPSLAISLAVYAFFLACVNLVARSAVVAAVFQGPDLLAQLLFTPLLAAWSIWVGIGISTRSSDVRVAQQLGRVASLPPIAVAYLIALTVIHATLGLALGLAAALLLVDGLGWRVVSAMFDRERLITATR